jgi:dethiobiotin synthetase
MNYFVTGTDTGVGKTFVTSGLIRFVQSRGGDVVGMKPICTGDNRDVHQIREASGSCEPEHLINPVWYRTPVAPYTASIIEDRLIDLDSIREAFDHLTRKHSRVLVEGAGGIAVPISARYDFRDLARDLDLDVVVVAANRLGVLNHTRLTVEAIRAAGLICSLIVLNSSEAEPDFSQPTNLSVLESLLDVPIVAVEHQQREFADLARHLWSSG